MMKIPVVAAVLFLIFSTTATILYPGGSHFIPDAKSFSFTRNFLSDLGVTTGYDIRPLPEAVNILFSFALMAAAVAIASFFSQFRSRKVKVFGWLTALTIIPLLFLPSDQYLWPHRISFVTAATFLLFASWSLYSTLNNNPLLKKFTLAFSVLISTYVLWLFFGPLPEASVKANIIHAVGQKLVVYGLILLISSHALFPPREKESPN